jgi:predicted CXXCH cytochrome family protein
MAACQRTWIVGLLLAGALASTLTVGLVAQPELPPPVDPDAPEPQPPPAAYVGSKACVTCHRDQAAGWAESRHGQALSAPDLPEAHRECEACHGPGSSHVGSTGKIPIGVTFKGAEPDAVEQACSACHAKGAEGVPAEWGKLDPKHWARTLHARGDVSCTACHRVHGGEAKALQKAPEALCLDCHAKELPKEGEYGHAPVTQGRCLDCHSPHGEGPRHNLVSDLGAACRSCHDPAAEGFTAAHLGYSVAESNCGSCHDPHSTDRERKLISENQHAPFAAHECETCHVADAAGPSKALKKPVKQLCATCHPPAKTHPAEDAQGRKLVRHAPVDQGLCTVCHNPHATTRPLGLKDRVDYVCFFCHSKTEDDTLKPVAHKPVQTGNCLLCHKGHVSPEPRLLNNESIALCSTCHATQGKFTHPVGTRDGKPVLVPGTKETVVCAHCHAVHGSDYDGILPQEETPLCRTCHKT